MKSPLPSGTIVHVAAWPHGSTSPDWSEKAVVARVTACMRARPGQFDPLANGYSPVRFASGGVLLIPGERLRMAADQSRKARAALRREAQS